MSNADRMRATIVFQKNWEAINKVCETCAGAGVVGGISCSWCGDGCSKVRGSGKHWRTIVNTGSSRSSKTASLIQCCHQYCKDNPNKRVTAWRDTKIDTKSTVLKDTLAYYKMWGVYQVGHIFNKTESVFTYDNASTFEMHGTDDEVKVMGLNKDLCWLNEPYKIDEQVYNQLAMRTSDIILIDWNPKENHWIDKVCADPRTKVIHSTFKHNPFCPPDQRMQVLGYQPVRRCALAEEKILTEEQAKAYDLVNNPDNYTPKQLKELIRCRENEAKNSANDFNWQVYGLGTKGERPNRIFHWEEISIEDYHKLQLPKYYGCDWGTVDPWGILEAKYQDGRLYLHELNYASENQIRERLSANDRAVIDAAAGTFEEKQESTGLVTWRFSTLGIPKDRPVVCDTNRPVKGNALRKAGWQAVPAIKLPGSILDGIDGLLNIRVYYTSTSVNIKEEQENYSRTVDKQGVVQEEPEDVYNHLIDPSRYVYQHLAATGIIKRL